MSEWKTFEEIIPEMGRIMQEDPERGYERVERRFADSEEPLTSSNWAGVFAYPYGSKYRIKPSTVTRTVTYPEPLRERPEYGESYWRLQKPVNVRVACAMKWEGDQFDEREFKNGRCFATEADAQAAFDALFGGE